MSRDHVTRADLRRIISEEITMNNQRIDEGWMEVLGDIGLKVIMSGAGRKTAAKAMRGMASVVVLPTKIDDAIFDAVGADKQNSLRKVSETLTNVAGTMGGLIPMAKMLEAGAKWLENLSDDDAAILQSAASSVAKGKVAKKRVV